MLTDEAKEEGGGDELVVPLVHVHLANAHSATVPVGWAAKSGLHTRKRKGGKKRSRRQFGLRHCLFVDKDAIHAALVGDEPLCIATQRAIGAERRGARGGWGEGGAARKQLREW